MCCKVMKLYRDITDSSPERDMSPYLEIQCGLVFAIPDCSLFEICGIEYNYEVHRGEMSMAS